MQSTPASQPPILLTGATGFVGGELLSRLLASRPGARIYCLIRSRGGRRAAERRRDIVDWARVPAAEAGRVVALEGDVGEPDLGLGDRREALAEEVGEIFHTAASTRFDLDLDAARRINRDGARHVADFAREAHRRGGIHRLHHVSTAYVAGSESDGSGAQPRSFRNSYEQSKWEAESAVSQSGAPWTVYRPSIIVGDSRTGRTPHFRVLYDPIKWVYLGGLSVLPCRPHVRLDVVPVDYVCDAIVALSRRPASAGRVHHLSAGTQRSISITEFADLAARWAHEWQRSVGEALTPPPRLLSPEEHRAMPAEEREQFQKLVDIAEQMAQTHLPYMMEEQLFDDEETRSALAEAGIECPCLRDYVREIIYYASDRRYGAL